MTRILAAALILGLAACGDSTPPPKPVAQPASPPPQAAAPMAAAPAPAPEAKAPEAPKPDPNRELARRVKQALEGDAKVQAAAIDVTAKEGRVSLWGTAATADERNRAGQIAGKVAGVASVDNQIKVVKGS
jgi:hyperosmotically inducible periplasmic protein